MQTRRHRKDNVIVFLAAVLSILSITCHSFVSTVCFLHSSYKYTGRFTMAECSLNTNNADKKTCVPCESLDTAAVLTRIQVEERLQTTPLPLWTIQTFPDSSILYLSRKFVAKNFQSALDCINAAGAIAEREGHHPDIHLINYREVEFVLYTHSVKGITENDVNMCRMLDQEVSVVYSPKWLKEHPEAAAKT